MKEYLEKNNQELPTPSDYFEDFKRLRGYDTDHAEIEEHFRTEAKNDLFTYKLLDSISQQNEKVYPSQGILLHKNYDYLKYSTLERLPPDEVNEILAIRRYYLTLFNHPIRMIGLKKTDSERFIAPPAIRCRAIEKALEDGLSLSIGDLGANVTGTDRERGSRTEAYAFGPFIKLGRQARNFFVGSSSPDVWNSSLAIATMAASHSLSGIPRNGVLYDVERQADIAKEIFEVLENMKCNLLKGRHDADFVYNCWKNNVMGTLEASHHKAITRARKLYEAGVRTFRVYSPEPGTGPIDTTLALRKEFGDEIEIFTSLIVDTEQAIKAQNAGSDGIFVGIGGGGRCITGVRSGSTVNWPEVLFQLRGEIEIPVIAEGGATESIAETLLLGASGVSVSRVVGGGTIESPGGTLYSRNNITGERFKPYGGEASARTKHQEGRETPFGIPTFVEGETTEAVYARDYDPHTWGTNTHNLHKLIENVILAFVFRNVRNIEELQALDPSPLRRITPRGDFQRRTH